MAPKANSGVIDIEYLTGEHHKLNLVSEIDRCRYLGLWGLGLKVGKELLPEIYNLDDEKPLRSALHVSVPSRTLRDTLEILVQRRLIVVPNLAGSKRIALVGLALRYPKRPIEVFNSAPWFGSVWFGSKELKRLPAQGAALDVDNTKSTKSTQGEPQDTKPAKSIAQAANQEDVGDVLAHWSRRFSNSELVESLAQKILTICQDRENWRDPRWLIDQVNIKADDPVAYLTTLLRKKPLTEPPDGERAFYSWDRWQKRQRVIDVANPIQGVLKSLAGNVT